MDELETRVAELLEALEFAGDWNDRYRLLVEWGEETEPLAEADCVEACEVAGCSSPLWLRVRRTGGKLEVRGRSPGVLPKALVAVVVRLFDGLSGASGSGAALVDRLDLRRHLSPTRVLVLQRMFDRALNPPVSAP
jgi:cysteine desulfuration protein SufE